MAPAPTRTQIDLRHVLQVVRQRKAVIIACGAVGVVLALAFAFVKTPVYTASSQILIQRQGGSVKFDTTNRSPIQQDIASEIELQFLKSQQVRERATELLGYRARIAAAPVGKGVVIRLTATDPDPDRAAEVANAYARAYIDERRKANVADFLAASEAIQRKVDDLDRQIADLETEIRLTQLGGGGAGGRDVAGLRAEQQALISQQSALKENLDTVQVSAELAQITGPQIVAEASPPTTPASPNPVRNTLAGLLGGLAIGLAVAFLLDYLDDSVTSKSDLEEATGGVTTLALIPRVPEWKDREASYLVSIEAPSSPVAEAYRSLRTSVQFASLERPIKVLQVTSPRSQEGKSTTAANLAVVLARAGQRVVLIDCDLRKPRIHEFFGLANGKGFTSVLLGQTSLVQAIQAVPGQDRLRVLASGPTPPDPSELLASRRTSQLFDAIREAADIILVDSPPVLPVTDALVVSDLADAVILVANAGVTGKKEAHRAVELLQQVDAPLIGTVLNGVGGARGYGYGYGYGYGERQGDGRGRWGRRGQVGTPPPEETAGLPTTGASTGP
jgi:non-specific protein-tyrosine kinase